MDVAIGGLVARGEFAEHVEGKGLALAAKLDKRDFLVFVLLGDGECYEGSVWEAAMFAAHHQLNNLVAIIDRNRQITLDYTEDCNQLDPFDKKWEAFGWESAKFPKLLIF